MQPAQDTTNDSGQLVKVYLINKRDSYVIVAQLSPEFTGRLVDRWQELEARQLSFMSVGSEVKAASALHAHMSVANLFGCPFHLANGQIMFTSR